MKCYRCGFQSRPGIKLCPNCGNSIGQAEPDHNQIYHIEDDPGFANRDAEYIKPTIQSMDIVQSVVNPSAKPKPRKAVRAFLKPKLLLGYAAIAVACISIYFFVLKDKQAPTFYDISSHAIQIYRTGGKTLVLDRNGDIVHSFERSLFTQYCRNRSAAVIYAMEPDETGNFKQYYVNDEDNIKLDDDVLVYEISEDGRYLFYPKDMLYNEYGIYQYDRRTKKETLLLQTEEKRFGLIEASPDGKTLTYSLIPEDYEQSGYIELETYLVKEGKEPEYLGDDLIVAAISNEAEYIYYFDYKDMVLGSLYVRRNGEDTKLLESFYNKSVWINQDYSEMLFSDGKDTYLYDGGGKILKVTGTEATEIILPYQHQTYDENSRIIMINNCKSFKNKVIRCSDQTLRRINEYYEAELICRLDPESQIALSSDENNLLYSTAKGNVRKVNDLSGKCTGTTLISQMSSFITTDNLSQVYYLIGDELFYKEGDNEAVWIADGASALMSNGDYTAAFFQTDRLGERGVLNYSFRGSEPEQLFDGAYVADIRPLDYGCAVQIMVTGAPGDYEYYYNPEGSIMLRLEEDLW